MSPLASKILGATLTLAALSATAQTPPATATAAAPAATPAPVTVDPSAAGIDADANALAALRRSTASQREQLSLLQTQAQVADIQKKLGTYSAGTSDIPQLVGLQGRPGHFTAEFLSGTAIITVSEGQWVTSDWRVERILENGVEMAKRGGKETHTILFGHEPSKASDLGPDRSPERAPSSAIPPRTFSPSGN